jgi:hypothetical protein
MYFIDDAMAAWSGLIIGFLNFLAGSASVSLGIRKSDKDFYSYFFGGMILRFALIFVVLFLLIRFFNMNKIILVSSLLTTYVGFMIIEVWLIYKFSASQGKGE